MEEICREALEKGVLGVAITDHLNIRNYEKQDSAQRFLDQHEAILEMREKMKGKLELSCGIEVGEYAEAPQKAEFILNYGWFDVVLGSCHAVKEGVSGFGAIFRAAKENNSDLLTETSTDEEILSLVSDYYDTMARMISMPRFFDVMAHVTLPFRYLGRLYGNRFSWRQMEDKIFPLLQYAVKNEVALELNTNGWTDELGTHTLPEKDLIQHYYQMGGRLITIGTDSHKKGRLTDGFDNAFKELKEIGFREYCFYRARKPIFYPIP